MIWRVMGPLTVPAGLRPQLCKINRLALHKGVAKRIDTAILFRNA